MNTPRTDAINKAIDEMPQHEVEWVAWCAEYAETSRQLERELAAEQEKVKELRDALEYWTHDGHLQTFQDRERFRTFARTILEKTK